MAERVPVCSSAAVGLGIRLWGREKEAREESLLGRRPQMPVRPAFRRRQEDQGLEAWAIVRDRDHVSMEEERRE